VRWGSAIVAVTALCASACRDDSCLRGVCNEPCAEIAFECVPTVDQDLYVGSVANAPLGDRLSRSSGADGDTLISNGFVTATISAIGTPYDLAPTGGNIIDYGPAGGADDISLVYQLSGILPDDAFAYRSMEIVEEPGVVGVTLRGTLDGRPEVPVVTHIELRPCDRGLRMRSELFNGSPDPQTFVLADGSHWGKRRVVPFVPKKGEGYAQPELDLLELTALWKPYDAVGDAAPSSDAPGYASLACDREQIEGVNDIGISALGTPMTIVEPGDTLTFERMLFTGGYGNGPAPALSEALLAREKQFGETARRLTGRVVGMDAFGDVRRASIVIRAGDVPVSAVVPNLDGKFEAIVAAEGPLTFEVWSFGVLVNAFDSTSDDVGDLEVPAPATARLSVTVDGAPAYGLVAFHPADEQTRARVTGSFHGRLGDCAPWLGPPNGASPACNRVLVDPTGTDIELPAGTYEVFATAGPERTLAHTTMVAVAAQRSDASFALQSLQVAPVGWLSADLHVHGRRSFDSMFPDEDRVKSFAATGIQVIAATDHDVVGDYTSTVSMFGLSDRIAVMGGVEATQLIPWMDIPGSTLPRVIGHFNFWPLVQVPRGANGGAPSDEYLQPGELFDEMEPLVGAHGMMQLNHPWDEPESGRDLGYLRAIEFDPRLPVADRSSNNWMLLDRPGGPDRHRNADWSVIEIINGADQVEQQKARVLWLSLLAQGFVSAGTGNSDSHGMSDAQIGWARNWVDAGTSVAGFDANAFDDAVRAGKLVAGNGIVVTVEIGPMSAPMQRRGLGLAPYTVKPGDRLFIEVRAAPWIPVEEVRIVTSRGTRVIANGDSLLQPADPFGVDGVVRFSSSVPVSDFVTKDDFLIIEAGLPFPDAADLDDDGVPDTTDNNGDGVIDSHDIEPDEDAGPFNAVADPSDASDPRYWVTRVVPGAYPIGFANPLILDVDGNGWIPPGLP
jgi:hypothetical protein